MGRKFYYPVIIGAAVMVSGCASMQLISFGASGLSYAITGKSISDHAISTVMEQDCALHRVVVGEEPCTEYDGEGILRKAKPGQPDSRYVVRQHEAYWQDIPTNRPTNNEKSDNQQAQTLAQTYAQNQRLPKLSNPDETVKKLMVQQVSFEVKPTKVEVRTVQRLEQGYQALEQEQHQHQHQQPLLFAVLGSYNELHFARQSLAKYPTLKAKVINNPAREIDKNATLYRVVAGPLTESEFKQKLPPKLHAWRLKLCAESLAPPPCTKQVFAAMLKAK